MATIDPKELCDLDAVGVSIWWLGQAGFAINAAGRVILIDPVIELQDDTDHVTSEIGLPLLVPLPIRARSLDRADIVLISHDHIDHLAPRTVPELINRTHAVFVGTERVVAKLRDLGLSMERIRIARYNQRLRVGDITIIPTPADHEEHDGVTAPGDCCGFIVRAAGLTFWHPGDTLLTEQHLKVVGVDVLFLPIAEHVLGTENALKLAKSTRARHIIPCHYGTYDSEVVWCIGDPATVEAAIEDTNHRFHILSVGEKLVLPAW